MSFPRPIFLSFGGSLLMFIWTLSDGKGSFLSQFGSRFLNRSAPLESSKQIFAVSGSSNRSRCSRSEWKNVWYIYHWKYLTSNSTLMYLLGFPLYPELISSKYTMPAASSQENFWSYWKYPTLNSMLGTFSDNYPRPEKNCQVKLSMPRE